MVGNNNQSNGLWHSSNKWTAVIEIIRPWNMLTSGTNAIAGISLYTLYSNADAGYNPLQMLLLFVASLLLYGGGIALNDVLDAKTDAVERPERAIPSGRLTLGQAKKVAYSFLFFGLLMASLISYVHCLTAIALTVSIIVYNAIAKHHTIAGPLVMGLCRGLNVMLASQWVMPLVGLLYVIYVAGITITSKGEVFGGNKFSLRLALSFYAIALQLWLPIQAILYTLNTPPSLLNVDALLVFSVLFLALLVLWFFLVGRPHLKAMKTLQALDIRKSVGRAVAGIVILDALSISRFYLEGLLIIRHPPEFLWVLIGICFIPLFFRIGKQLIAK